MKAPDGGGTKRQNIKTNIGRFFKLFIILGFYWTGDILSTALALEYGQEKTCGFRIFADLTGLFSVQLAEFRERLGTSRNGRNSSEGHLPKGSTLSREQKSNFHII